MSKLSIASYFPFRRTKIVKQTVTPEATGTHIQVQPDKRFQPICQGCGQKASGVHSWTQRKIRDLNLANACSWITCRYRKVFCARCQRYPYRRLGIVSPLSEGDRSFGPLCLSTVPSDDPLRSGSTPCCGLENGQNFTLKIYQAFAN